MSNIYRSINEFKKYRESLNKVNEANIEQLEKQFVETGKLSEESFEEIKKATKKGAYATWLAKNLISKSEKEEPLIKEEDIYKYKEYLDIYHKHKDEYKHKDIFKYRTKHDLDEFIKTSVEIKDRIKERPDTAKGVKKDEKYANLKIGEVDGFDVYKIPKGSKELYGVSCDLGSGAEWCTATGKTRTHFDEYISRDDLYIFIKQDGSGEKYQFHYEDEEFKDKDDISII